jgi:hypothetical protein
MADRKEVRTEVGDVHAPNLSPKEVKSLRQWLSMVPEQDPPPPKTDDPYALKVYDREAPHIKDLMRAGNDRNAVRHAERWGPALIAALVDGGHLEPGENPVKALNSLLGFDPERDC